MSVATRPLRSPVRRLARLGQRFAGFTLSGDQYARVAWAALVALTVVAITGAAVRLTGSGLGCPDWPKCYGRALPPLDTHAVIEYGNRVVSGLVGVVAVLASLLAWRRRPFRRELAVLGLLLPLGVLAQAVLGGFTVRERLHYGFVMGHFVLSMVILVAAVALVRRATERDAVDSPPSARDASDRSLERWAVRGLAALGALTLLVGSAATAAGPHAGGQPGQAIERLKFLGASTMDWTIHRHGDLGAALGVVAVSLWWWLGRRGAGREVRKAVATVCALLAVQGAVGLLQYYNHLPAGLVWVHFALATLTWLALLWAVAAAGHPAAEPAPRPLEAPNAAGQARLRQPA